MEPHARHTHPHPRSSGIILCRVAGIAILLMLPAELYATICSGNDPFTGNQLVVPYTQELYAVGCENLDNLQGIAVNSNQELLASSCQAENGKGAVRRYSAQTVVPAKDNCPLNSWSQTQLVHKLLVTYNPTLLDGTTAVIPCGLTKHSNGSIYATAEEGSDLTSGVINLGLLTGTSPSVKVQNPAGHDGAFGIVENPKNNNLVYVGRESFGSPKYHLYTISPTLTGDTLYWDDSVENHSPPRICDGLTFDPSKEYLFCADNKNGDVVILHNLGNTADPNPVNVVHVGTFPDGIAFHVTPPFVLTNDNGGQLTKIDWNGAPYSSSPFSILPFPNGGFRGDLAAVASDGCFYVSQSFGGAYTSGTRFCDGSTVPDASVVKLCPGFDPQGGDYRWAKRVVNNTGIAVNDLEVVLLGEYAVDDPKLGLFTTFGVTEGGGLTTARWSGTTISAGGSTTVNFRVKGQYPKILAVSWTLNGSHVGCIEQTNADIFLSDKDSGNGTASLKSPSSGGTTIVLTNDVTQCAAVPVYARVDFIEWHTAPVDPALMEPGLDRSPIRTDTINTTTLLQPGRANTFRAPAPPDGAFYLVLGYRVSQSSDLDAPGVTIDLLQTPIVTAASATGIPALDATALVALVILLGLAGVILQRRRALRGIPALKSLP
jgi:hypothetical protein